MHPKAILAAVAAFTASTALAYDLDIVRPSPPNNMTQFVANDCNPTWCMPTADWGPLKGAKFIINNNNVAYVLYGSKDCTVGKGTRLLAAPGTPSWDGAFEFQSIKCGYVSAGYLSKGQQEELNELNSKIGQ